LPRSRKRRKLVANSSASLSKAILGDVNEVILKPMLELYNAYTFLGCKKEFEDEE
jgi:hypothetical protein